MLVRIRCRPERGFCNELFNHPEQVLDRLGAGLPRAQWHLSVKVQKPRLELAQSDLAALRARQKSTDVTEKPRLVSCHRDVLSPPHFAGTDPSPALAHQELGLVREKA
jgi:hypothetical protein